MKNVVIAALSLTVVGLGAYVVTLKRDSAPAPNEDPVVLEQSVEAAAPERTGDNPDPAPPKPAPTEFQPSVDQLKKANNLIGALFEANQALEEEGAPSLARGIKQIVESPELKGMIRQRMSGQVKRSHAALFRRLGLSPDQEVSMMDLLIEQNIAGIETGFHWMTGNHELSSASIVAAREKMHEDILQQFGPEALTEYQYWEATKNERESLTKFNRSLGDATLDEETSDWMVGMMYETRGEFEELDYLSQPENFDPEEMTPEYRKEVMGQVDTLHGRYLEEAAPVLNEDQLTQYEANLARESKQLDRFLKFSHGMVNQGKQDTE